MLPRISQTSLQRWKKKHQGVTEWQLRGLWPKAACHGQETWVIASCEALSALTNLGVWSPLVSFPWPHSLHSWDGWALWFLEQLHLSLWTHTIGSQESFFVLDTGPSYATHAIPAPGLKQSPTSLQSPNCLGLCWLRDSRFWVQDHSCLHTSLPRCLLVFTGCCVAMSFLFWWTSCPPCHVNFAELLLYSQI